MRSTCIAFLLVLPLASRAERLITIPVGKKLVYRSARFEALFDTRSAERSRYYLAAGLTPHIDAEVYSDRLDLADRFTSFDIAYNQTAPITDLAPGISVGMLDVANKTQMGRRFFGAITWRIGLEGAAVNDVPMEVTVGAATNVRHPIFVGAMVPLSSKLRLLAEHDSEHITAGIELRPFEGIAVRALFRSDRTLVGLSLTRRF